MSETTLMVDGGQLTKEEQRRLDGLLTRAQKGDKKALGELRPFMDKPGMWEAVDDLERPTAELEDLADQLAATALLLAGYHRHDRGEWRRRR